MTVLVACEFSGTVRDAFADLGHDAWSCDLEPAKGNHIQDDVLNVLDLGWDLMIAHPPCTYLSAAGMHYCTRSEIRRRLRDKALDFVRKLAESPIEKIAIENPVGYLSTAWRKPDQVIRMNEFGHAEAIKPTCLWLKNLPPLEPTKIVEPIKSGKHGTSMWYEKTKCKKLRSVTFPGLASAMANQWSKA